MRCTQHVSCINSTDYRRFIALASPSLVLVTLQPFVGLHGDPAKLSCGYQPLDVCAALHDSITSCSEHGGDFIVAPLVHPRLKRDAEGVSGARTDPLTRSDTVLQSSRWSTVVVGAVSEWIDLDAPAAEQRKASENVLREEVAWATHLNVPAVLLPPPSFLQGASCVNYAHVLNQLVLQAHYLQVWVRIPLVATSLIGSPQDPWHVWSTMSALCSSNASVRVALELTADLPSQSALDRWVAEPVKAVIIPTSIFLTNESGFPELSSAHERYVVRMHRHGVQFILKGRVASEDGMSTYQSYLNNLISCIPESTEQEEFEAPYHDYLQAPLQPLMDNLESATYETFEQDPIKYARYQEAIELAISDHQKKFPAAPHTVVMVVGAGRGPLVKASLRASDAAGRKIKVYAVEKNPNAVITLRNLRANEWGDRVTVVHQDMRLWKAPEMADILVSELLGSWETTNCRQNV